MLCLGPACTAVDRGDLATYSPPPATGRHRPIAHAALVDAILTAATDRGLAISREQWGISHGGLRLYGALDFALPAGLALPTGIGASIGIRHANDKSMAVNLIAGARVFVCSNGCFAGELTTNRRHTAGLDLGAMVASCLDRYLEQIGDLRTALERMQAQRITDLRAKALIHDAFLEHQVMAAKYLPMVADRYFRSDEHRQQFPDRTRWGLYNAHTEVIKQLSPPLQLRAHRRLATAFDPSAN